MAKIEEYKKQRKIELLKEYNSKNITQLAKSVNIKSPANLYHGRYSIKKYNLLLKKIATECYNISEKIMSNIEEDLHNEK